jgi:hypothetical protein
MIRMFIAAMVASLPLTGAFAAEAPRTIDFTQTLKGPTGDDITNCLKLYEVTKACTQKESVTLGDIASVALETLLDEDRGVDGKVKFERDVLARKIYKNARAELSPDDIATIKQRIGKAFGPLQIGATWPLLDPTLSK